MNVKLYVLVVDSWTLQHVEVELIAVVCLLLVCSFEESEA